MPHRIPEIGPAPFITFYSFKGGVGRSMAVMNIGSLLATRGFRVLVLDMDLEAPGASYLLQNQNKQQELNQIPPQNLLGFVDLFGEANTKGEDADMGVLTHSQIVAKYTHPLALFEIPEGEDVVKNPGGQLRIMPAGRPGTDYARRLQDLDLPGLYQEGVGKPLIAAFKKIIQDSNEFDFVLVDSRTGFSDESGICTRDLADRLVVITGLNHQNVEGTAAFFRALRACTDGTTPVQVVLSPVPQGEDELVSKREEIARSAFEEAWGKPFNMSLQIPYHPRLALTEEPYSTRRVHSEIRNAYRSIEAKLLQDMGLGAERLMQQADNAIDAKDYSRALRLLQQAVRFDNGPQALTRIGIKLLTPFRPDTAIRPLYKFLSEQLPLQQGLLHTIGAELFKQNDALCGVAWERLANEFPDDAGILGNYASFLTNIRRDHDSAEALYKRALNADPNRAVTLGNYAFLLTNIRKDHDSAEALYKRALNADPNCVTALINYALFLAYIRADQKSAEVFFKRAVDADPKHAEILGYYASFLTNIRKDHDSAEAFYKRALDADPKHAHILGNYVSFLLTIRKDTDSAEAFFKRALDADPKHAGILAMYAYFLSDIRKDHDSAEAFYKRALDADPKHAHILGNYVSFLLTIRKDTDSAEAFFKRALDADPKHAGILAMYAYFLTDIRKDHDSAEAFFKRALDADPKHANTLGSYANFLTNIRKDHDSAEALYKRALDADPKHANNLGNYAMLLFAQGKYSEGAALLNRAFSGIDQSPALLAELHFYSYAHLWQESPNALPSLKELLLSGARSPNWPLDRNMAQSKSQGHPHPDLVAALAAVISDKAPIESLDAFPVWQATQALPPADPAKPAS
jgi:Tfp pilus assembly protein PilF/MinD-like ATPase involved in chromosome partitioning or flagellar assembly